VNIWWLSPDNQTDKRRKTDMRTLILENDRKFECSQKEKRNLRCKIPSRI
jgi:hypothetical protein